MSADPNKKSPRTFQCRDALWETFEQLARELECSVDYLVNEAMKQYARQRASSRTPLPGTNRVPEGSEASPVPGAAPRVLAPAARPGFASGRAAGPARAAGSAPPPLPPPPVGAMAPQPFVQPPPQAYSRPPAAVPLPSPPGRPLGTGPIPRTVPPPVPPIQRSLPTPPPPPQATSAPPPASHVPQVAYAAPVAAVPQAVALSIIYQGERFQVNKERYIIGRGKQSSDLTLKDPNVSRQHAMVEYHSGVYFMVDMGSTNGVEYNGQRIARKQIGEGDTFRICDHDLVFTFL